ncbi:MAG: glycosyltransferase [Colwellia sp.]
MILKYLTRHKRVETKVISKYYPDISIVLCMYNAADQITARIDNILASNYPKKNINIVIVSDGSTDHPEKIIEKLNYPNITLISYENNQGKSYALNQGIKHVTTELVAFADIRQTFHPDALYNLSIHFADKTIGAISGNLEISLDAHNPQSDPGLYWKYEKWIREKESDLNSMLGVTGAIYMARSSLLPKIPEDTLLDDMYIPLSMVKQGYKIKFDSKAIAYDVSSSSTAEEFNRKVRTLAGNFQLMTQLPWLLSMRKNPLFFQFFSHKVLRLFTPYFLITILISSYYAENILIKSFLSLQLGFYLYSVLCFHLAKFKIKLPLGSFSVSFCSLQLAALCAGWKYCVNDPKTLWHKH